MPPSKKSFESSERPNTLGLREKELEQFLDRLESRAGSDDHPKRDFARWPFRQTTIVVRLEHPGGSRVDVKMACRNLSQGGVGVLHNTYVHVGTLCQVCLPHLVAGETWVRGEVTRCAHLQGVIHQVGIKFDTPLNIRDYVRQDALDSKLSLEVVDPAQIAGCLLHIDGSEMDQKIVKHFLRDTKLRLRSASTGEEGIAMACEGCDIVLCDYSLPDMTGTDLVYRLRGEGVTVPIVLCTSDGSQEVRNNIRAARANAFLPKPFAQEVMIRAVAEFLMADNDVGQSAISMAGPAAELVNVFVATLRDYANKLNKAIEEDRPMDVYVICIQIKGTAPSLGFKVLGERADEIAGRLSQNMSLAVVVSQLRDFIAACRVATAA